MKRIRGSVKRKLIIDRYKNRTNRSMKDNRRSIIRRIYTRVISRTKRGSRRTI